MLIPIVYLVYLVNIVILIIRANVFFTYHRHMQCNISQFNRMKGTYLYLLYYVYNTERVQKTEEFTQFT